MARQENYYLLFDIPFDPPISNKEFIKNQITKRKDDFSRNGDNEAVTWIEKNKKNIISELTTIDSKTRKKMQIEADEICRKIKDELNDANSKNILDGKKRKEIYEKYIITKDKLKKIETTKENLLETYYYSPFEKEGEKNRVKNLIKDLDGKTIFDYDYLEGDYEKGDRLINSTMDDETILGKLRDKSDAFKNSKSGASIRTVRDIISEIVTMYNYKYAFNSCNVYNDYMRRKDILDSLNGEVSSTKKVDDTKVQKCIGELEKYLDIPYYAKPLLLAFCKDKGLDVEIIECPNCHKKNYTSATVCTDCKAPLKDPEELRKLEKICDSAEQFINKLEFVEAERKLKEAAAIWKESPRYKQLFERFNIRKKKLSPLYDEMNKARHEKRYNRARELYKEIRQDASEYEDVVLAKEIEDAYNNAQRQFDIAKKLEEEPHTNENIKAQAEACEKALQYCKDLPGVNEYMPPPKSVINLKINSGKNKSIILSWGKYSDEADVNFIVQRSSKPINKFNEGETIYEGVNFSYEDRGIAPNINYYYNVFAKHGDKISDAVPNQNQGYKCDFVPDAICEIGNIRRDGDHLFIELELLEDIPKDMTGFLVLINPHKHAKTRQEHNTKEIFIPISNFNTNGQLILENVPRGVVYITILDAHNYKVVDDGKYAYFSQPVFSKIIDKKSIEIIYDFEIKKSFFGLGKINSIELHFYVENDTTFPIDVPKLEVYIQNNSPYNIMEGELLTTINSSSVNANTWSHTIDVKNKINPDTYIGIITENGEELKSRSGLYKIS